MRVPARRYALGEAQADAPPTAAIAALSGLHVALSEFHSCF